MTPRASHPRPCIPDTRLPIWLIAGVLSILVSGSAGAQSPPVVTEVRLEQEGHVVTDAELLELIETPVGQPLSMEQVKDSEAHLMGLNRFDSIEVIADKNERGVQVTYRLFPLHPIERVEFRGRLDLDEGTLRRALTERYGTAPPLSRVDDAMQLLRQVYRDHGYPNAVITREIVQEHNPDRATLVVQIQSGARAIVKDVTWDELDQPQEGVFVGRPDVRAGRPYDLAEIRRALDRYVERMRKEGYYEAIAEPSTTFEPDGAVVRVTFRRGPKVRVVFAGDAIPRSVQERLVPVQTEASVVEDLLENWELAIEDYLRGLGHRDADVRPTRETRGGELIITFNISKGPRFLTSQLRIVGNKAIGEMDLRALLRMKEGEPFVEATLDGGAALIEELYRSRGFSSVSVTPDYAALPGERPSDPRRVQATVTVNEGARTTIESISFSGNTVFTESDLRAMMTLTEGVPLSQRELIRSRDSIEERYRDRGYLDVNLRPTVAATAKDAGDVAASLLVSITEGPQTVIDKIIIEGNDRTSRETIERELRVRPGDPWGVSAVAESQTRLADLGLFRRVRLDPRTHVGETRRDMVVRLEEVPATTIGWGGGLEFSSRLRPTGVAGLAEERIEVVPRGAFEIGRRNMWGKNRSINLYTRASARARDTVTLTGIDSSYGLNEYRVYGTFREPKLFGSPGELLITGLTERAIRTSYSFDTVEARAQLGGRISRLYTGVVGFSIENTELFDVDPSLTGDNKPLIDRFFPQVRLSKFTGSLIRNTRDNDIDPSRGTFVSADAEVAARAIGSEVGYLKGFVQGSWYRQLPSARRIIFAVRGALGAAHGFPREVFVLDADGNPIVGDDGIGLRQNVQDLPASERFFAGGSTTNRGFSLDRLGTEETTSPGGFPLGGNAEILINSELRVSIFNSLAGVVFMDAGNVYKDAEDLSSGLRPAAGFGFHYRSPFGPLRAEIGFNLDRRELTPGQLERGHVFHISVGPAF